MKWLKLKELHCVVPNNTESYDKVELQIANSKVSIGKITYDEKLNLDKYRRVKIKDNSKIKLWDKNLFGKNVLLGEYIMHEKKSSKLEGELFFKLKGEYRLAYIIEFKNGKPFFKMTQLDCLRTASNLSQDKVYFMFNKKKFQTKFIVNRNKHYNLTKYPGISFGKSLEVSLFTSELLKSDKMIGKNVLKAKIASKGETEIVFDRDSCLYHLKIEVFDLNFGI